MTRKNKGRHYEIVYTWPRGGREEVRYSRPVTDLGLAIELRDMRRRFRKLGIKGCLYSIRRTA